MISKLDNKDEVIATEIRAVFQASYAIEAKLLKATDFPPLKRTLEEYLYCDSEFYGFLKNTEIAAVVEIKNDENSTLIQSLVVEPKYFRQGIAQQLIEFVFDTFDSEIFNVETGLANEPAIHLYKKFGFREIKQWDTEHGIIKIRFEKIITSQT